MKDYAVLYAGDQKVCLVCHRCFEPIGPSVSELTVHMIVILIKKHENEECYEK